MIKFALLRNNFALLMLNVALLTFMDCVLDFQIRIYTHIKNERYYYCKNKNNTRDFDKKLFCNEQLVN